MAARAIIGILLGILFVPVIYMLLWSYGSYLGTDFATWFWKLFGDGNFVGFMEQWVQTGAMSTVAPLIGPAGLITAFGAGSSLLGSYIPFFGVTLAIWAMVGAWSGAIERSPGRGIGVAVGIWLGWFIITLIMYFIDVNMVVLMSIFGISTVMDLILGQLLPLIVGILVAAIFGAMTKSEEF
jgi:hypothetical protein